jgi:hypothetical protein
LRKTKNDAKDSFLIAETIRIGRFSSTPLADEDILSMRQLCRHRMDLVDYIADQSGVPEKQSFLGWKYGKLSA